ncbi:hypothetical protein [Actinomycetospora termitidis]|uniref:Uncharacterized protein n=1 Tax=Actinomycetospora termitidis TaxID=3053470 RepID=A0ABT7MHQ8_9PSEU|nr:hypothetical protein [Actinomycetospora sp. Odt1-22]MDL5160221.1 hypothetical protein [Actinomycetospora sp. Odt1-22]
MAPRWHLHARLFRGTLDAPVRNELRTAEGDDRAALEELADDLRERGWRVWLYERYDGRAGSLGEVGRPPGFTVVAEWREI